MYINTFMRMCQTRICFAALQTLPMAAFNMKHILDLHKQ